MRINHWYFQFYPHFLHIECYLYRPVTYTKMVFYHNHLWILAFLMHGLPTKIAEILMYSFLINTFESAKLIQIVWNEVTILLPSLFCSDPYGGLEFFKIWMLYAVISFIKFWWTVRFYLITFVWKMRITVWTFVLPSILAHFIKNCYPKHAEYDKRQLRQSLH